jgi:hypothetical protein
VDIGEENNIFLLLANAEMFFDSALAYEVPVLEVLAGGLPEAGEDSDGPRGDR